MIQFDRIKKTFTLTTEKTMYQMQIGPVGHLLHLYYGPVTEGCFDYLQLTRDCGFSPNPYDLQEGRGWSLDTQAQEYFDFGQALENLGRVVLPLAQALQKEEL